MQYLCVLAIDVNRPSGISQTVAIAVNRTKGVKDLRKKLESSGLNTCVVYTLIILLTKSVSAARTAFER